MRQSELISSKDIQLNLIEFISNLNFTPTTFFITRLFSISMLSKNFIMPLKQKTFSSAIKNTTPNKFPPIYTKKAGLNIKTSRRSYSNLFSSSKKKLSYSEELAQLNKNFDYLDMKGKKISSMFYNYLI